MLDIALPEKIASKVNKDVTGLVAFHDLAQRKCKNIAAASITSFKSVIRPKQQYRLCILGTLIDLVYSATDCKSSWFSVSFCVSSCRRAITCNNRNKYIMEYDVLI